MGVLLPAEETCICVEGVPLSALLPLLLSSLLNGKACRTGAGSGELANGRCMGKVALWLPPLAPLDGEACETNDLCSKLASCTCVDGPPLPPLRKLTLLWDEACRATGSLGKLANCNCARGVAMLLLPMPSSPLPSKAGGSNGPLCEPVSCNCPHGAAL